MDTHTQIIDAFKEALAGSGYQEIATPYVFADIREGRSVTEQVALAAFSRSTRSYHDAEVGVAFGGAAAPSAEFAQRHRALGSPLFFEVAADGKVQPWGLGREAPRALGRPFKPDRIAAEFHKHRNQWTPTVLGRVKRAADVTGDPQLELFNPGLLGVLEQHFAGELQKLLQAAFMAVREAFRSVHKKEPPVRSLFPYLFRFLTARIFMDRADARGWRSLEKASPREVFEKAEAHSGSGLLKKLPAAFLHEKVLAAAWEAICSRLNFQNLWVPDLAEIYESAFITRQTRKELGTHSTPHGLAQYVVAKLPWDTLPLDGRRVFEPFCGHGVLLASAMEKLGEDLTTARPHLTPAQRHEYFRRRLTGVEKDPFAIEVCRLMLTLTDYPNHNSWDLHPDDVFTWQGWDETLRHADVVLANPPYEKFKPDEKVAAGAVKPNPPSEFLRRLMLQPPAMLGLILPQSFLSGPSFREANRELARRYGEIQIVELPKMFRYADNETIALMAYDRREVGRTVNIHYAEVPRDGLDGFLNDFQTGAERTREVEVPEGREVCSLRLPAEGSAVAHLTGTKLGNVAKIRLGVQWKARTDRMPQSAPRSDVASDSPRPGYVRGVEKMKGNLAQFRLQRIRYLSMLENDQDPSTRAHLHPWDCPKVVCNRFRFERYSPWRLAAFADSGATERLAFTKQFFAVWPSEAVSRFAILAVLNSPVANAVSFAEDMERDNHISTLEGMTLPPVPLLAADAAIDQQARQVQDLFAEDTSLADLQPGDWREARREALIRLDALVLDAYGLSAAEQRKLLDMFQGHRRPLADIEFTGYFPEHFKDDITLSDFVRINYEWDDTNDRRCDLIHKEFHGGGLSDDEERELEHLQHLADLVVNLKAPHPISKADEIIEKLKAEGKWVEMPS